MWLVSILGKCVNISTRLPLIIKYLNAIIFSKKLKCFKNLNGFSCITKNSYYLIALLQILNASLFLTIENKLFYFQKPSFQAQL